MAQTKGIPLLDAATLLVGWSNRMASRGTEKVFVSGEVVQPSTVRRVRPRRSDTRQPLLVPRCSRERRRPERRMEVHVFEALEPPM